MLKTIQQGLKNLEEKEKIKILFAVESGSRAWGFASSDSDYDVRFVYAGSLDNYLSINDRKDVIELPLSDVLDINGWDLRKALRLFRNSNATLYEWILSPIIYEDNYGLREKLLSISKEYFSLQAGMHHYVSMTKSVYEGYLKSEKPKLKKYFYGLRNALAIKWIRERGEVPPMEFSSLRQSIEADKQLKTRIDDWLVLKSLGDKKTLVNQDLSINGFLESEIVAGELFARNLKKMDGDVERLNEIFRQVLKQV